MPLAWAPIPKTMLPPNQGLTSVAPLATFPPAPGPHPGLRPGRSSPTSFSRAGTGLPTPASTAATWLAFLLTTHHAYPQRSFSFTHDTSAATAIAAKQITELWSDYPLLWPETIRALYVASAHGRRNAVASSAIAKGAAYTRLFQRYGYGVPDLKRAHRAAHPMPYPDRAGRHRSVRPL
jgi:hypothetical protein